MGYSTRRTPVQNINADVKKPKRNPATIGPVPNMMVTQNANEKTGRADPALATSAKVSLNRKRR
jgi:hypothetical protein